MRQKLKNISEKRKAKLEQERIEREQMWEMFRKLWWKRGHYSEISGKWLGMECLSVFFHHCLPKNKYKKAMLDEDNIILMTFDEHQRVENNPNCFEKVNNKRKILLEKYG